SRPALSPGFSLLAHRRYSPGLQPLWFLADTNGAGSSDKLPVELEDRMAKGLFDLSGKVALVTGGNGGIGLGFARGIARQGGSVVIWARNEQKNATARAQLESLGV